jgi:hypothetical protein
MACCGNNRTAIKPGLAVRTPAFDAVKTAYATRVSFRYVGMTGLTATGAATGTRYRFGSPGSVLAVDARDEVSLRSIPQLRRVYPG